MHLIYINIAYIYTTVQMNNRFQDALLNTCTVMLNLQFPVYAD